MAILVGTETAGTGMVGDLTIFTETIGAGMAIAGAGTQVGMEIIGGTTTGMVGIMDLIGVLVIMAVITVDTMEMVAGTTDIIAVEM